MFTPFLSVGGKNMNRFFTKPEVGRGGLGGKSLTLKYLRKFFFTKSIIYYLF